MTNVTNDEIKRLMVEQWPTSIILDSDVEPMRKFIETVLAHQQVVPQGDWVDLTWDDYLELAGQERFYVKDPHTGIMDFCSHEFTKAAIELFKDKNA